MKIRHDPDANAAKIYLNNNKYHHSQMITPSCILDFDEQGNIIAVELLNLTTHAIDLGTIEYTDITKQKAK